MLSIGYDYRVPLDNIVAIVAVDSAPIRRMIQRAKEDNTLEDCTCGKKTRSAVITSGDTIYLSAFTADSLSNRLYSAYLLTKVINPQSQWVSRDYYKRLQDNIA